MPTDSAASTWADGSNRRIQGRRVTGPTAALEERNAPLLQDRCKMRGENWSGREDLNLRPLGPEPSALPG